MRQNLDDVTFAAPKAKDRAGVRVERERLLDENRKPRNPFAHVRETAAQVNLVGRNDSDHRASSASTMRSTSGSTAPSIRNRAPPGKAMTILPPGSDVPRSAPDWLSGPSPRPTR